MIYKTARRVAIGLVGSTVVLIGVAMIILPGPAIVVVPAGLAILAIEFAWAGRLLKRLKEQTRNMFNACGGHLSNRRPPTKTDSTAPSAPL